METDRSTSVIRRNTCSFFLEHEDLEFGHRVGGGASCIVYKGYWLKCPVAIKKWFDPNCDEQTQKEFNAETLTIRDLRHPNIVQFIGACVRPPNLCIVMEHLPKSLFEVLHDSNTQIDDQRIRMIAIDIARSVLYLHSRRPQIIHRDLKPANFMVDGSWRVKLCDFGLASSNPSQRRAGTVAYMAPELFNVEASFNASVDVYAFGVVLNETIGRRPPFDGVADGETARRVVSGQRPEIPLSCDPKLRELIKTCWHKDPRSRPTFAQILDILSCETI